MALFYRFAFICILIIHCSSSDSRAQIKLSENFESGIFPPTGWTVVNNSDINGEWKYNKRNTNSGNGCAVSNYSLNGSRNLLISKRFIPAAGDSLVFYFKQTFWNNYNDTFNVLLSNTDSLPGSFTYHLFNFNENQNYPVYYGYGRYSAGLNSFAGQTVWIAFQHKNVNGDNIRIDDITVGTPSQYEVSMVENVFPKGNFGSCSFDFLFPSAKIKNNGTESIPTGFNVTYKITGPVNYTSVKQVTLNAGETKVMYFDTAYFSAPGTYSVKVYSSLAGDPNRNNDTIYSSFNLVQADYGGGQYYNGGYYYSNSTSCSGSSQSHPEFSWKDTLNSISLIKNGQINTQIPVTGNADNGYFSLGHILPEGYSFRYYNQNYDSIFISTNGIIGFKKNDALLSSDPTKIANMFYIQLPAICPLWTDFDFTNGGPAGNRLSYKLAGKYFIVTFDKAMLKSGNASEYVSFQVCLELVNNTTSNSRFIVQYNQNASGQDFIDKYRNNTLRPHFVGFKNTSGTNYMIYRYKDSTGLVNYGTLFNSSVAVEFGASPAVLNNRSSDLNLRVKLEGIYPNRDTVRIDLRDSYYPYNILETKKIYLGSNGWINCKLTIPAENYNYYLAVRHRNSIETWSREFGEQFPGFNLNYDFSTDITHAYANNLKLINGSYYIYSGDPTQDGLIDISDYTKILTDVQNFLLGYQLSDLNGDGLVDLADYQICDNNGKDFVRYWTPLVQFDSQGVLKNNISSGK
ncbi:MAG: choice-of-anchor J domain-containing protein [Bacteroidetes bacterium]|nr:choice-of-anchor J domain-containing protein [Bacteroidota bacterium]